MTTNAPARPNNKALQKTFSWVAVALAVLIFAQPILAGMGLDDAASNGITLHYHNAMTILGVSVILGIVAIIWALKGGPKKALWFSALLLVLNLAMFAIGEIGGMQSLHMPLGVITLVGAIQVVTMGFRYRGEAAAAPSVA